MGPDGHSHGLSNRQKRHQPPQSRYSNSGKRNRHREENGKESTLGSSTPRPPNHNENSVNNDNESCDFKHTSDVNEKKNCKTFAVAKREKCFIKKFGKKRQKRTSSFVFFMKNHIYQFLSVLFFILSVVSLDGGDATYVARNLIRRPLAMLNKVHNNIQANSRIMLNKVHNEIQETVHGPVYRPNLIQQVNHEEIISHTGVVGGKRKSSILEKPSHDSMRLAINSTSGSIVSSTRTRTKLKKNGQPKSSMENKLRKFESSRRSSFESDEELDLFSSDIEGHAFPHKSSSQKVEEKVSSSSHVKSLKVLNLNTWGLNYPWSENRHSRMLALREVIALSDYDIILLQEVWFRSDYRILRTAAEFATPFETFNSACKDIMVPFRCSGVMILSRHPILEVDFMPFTQRGNFWNFDGEIFVNKGVGRARVDYYGLAVDVFTSHFVSYTLNPSRDNSKIRYSQALEALRFIRASNAVIKFFGGDMNALPTFGPREPYGILRSYMTDTLTERYRDASMHAWFASFGNMRNTYSQDHSPVRIDYLMYWFNPTRVKMKTNEFLMPLLMTRTKEGNLISLSDHEALLGEYSIEIASKSKNSKHKFRGEIRKNDAQVAPTNLVIEESHYVANGYFNPV